MDWILLLIAAAVLLWGIWCYNKLISLRNQVDEAWSGIDVQLQRRHELIPNLLATVKGYMNHESGVLERVTRLRSDPSMARSERASQESGLSRSIGRLFALSEDYPDLKASEGFSQLHGSLVKIEEQLQYARRYYNGSVRDNNNRVDSFPSMIIARAFHLINAELLEIEFASQRSAPEIKL
jgi:LemA protein